MTYFFVASAVIAAGLVWTFGRWRTRPMVIFALVTAVAIFAAGVVDWRRQITKDTPLVAYVLLATLPLCAATVVFVMAQRKVSWITQWIVAAILLSSLTYAILLFTAQF